MICSKVKWSWWIASKQIMLRLKKLNKFITNETLGLYLTTCSKNFICNISQCARKFFKFLTNSEWPLFEVRTFSKFSDEISGLTRARVLRPNLQSWNSHLGFSDGRYFLSLTMARQKSWVKKSWNKSDMVLTEFTGNVEKTQITSSLNKSV